MNRVADDEWIDLENISIEPACRGCGRQGDGESKIIMTADEAERLKRWERR